jgi:hypothetical protein
MADKEVNGKVTLSMELPREHYYRLIELAVDLGWDIEELMEKICIDAITSGDIELLETNAK